MRDINRSLMIVRGKQQLVDWIRSVDDTGDLDLEDVRDDSSAYLVPELETAKDEAAIILWCWDVVFEQELFSWYTDDSLWPSDRTPEMFLEWFEVEFHSTVTDLIDDLPLESLGDDDEDDDDDVIDATGDPSSNGH